METVILQGFIEHGKGKGHLAGFPTANLHMENPALPAYGVYASVLVTMDDRRLPGVTNVGTRPTADTSEKPTVETWLPGYKGDLYGQRVTLILLDYLRGIRPFNDMGALKAQIDLDAASASAVSDLFMANSVISHSPEKTREIGAHIGAHLNAGDVLTLTGHLGAGKSELARGIARSFGITGALPSPTFTILNVYDGGRVPLYHYDWYRIEDPEELIAIGAEEHLPGEGVTLVEWSEQAPELLPEKRLAVRLLPLNEQTRMIYFEPLGGFRAVKEWLTEL